MNINMINAISAYQQLAPAEQGVSIVAPNRAKEALALKESSGFGDLVQNFVKQTNADQVSADQAIEDLILGKNDNIQQVVMAIANADMAFQFFMEIRNKVIDSYNELMRMQF